MREQNASCLFVSQAGIRPLIINFVSMKHVILILIIGISLNTIYASTSWNVNPVDYQYSMNMVATFQGDDSVRIDEADLIAAFHDTVCVGVAKPFYNEQVNKWLLFLTIYGNQDNEVLHFRIYDAERETVFQFLNRETFVSNKIIGSVDNPFVLSFHNNLSDADAETNNMFLKVYPNPASGYLKIELPVNASGKLEIYDIKGSGLATFILSRERRIFELPLNRYQHGRYFIRLATEEKEYFSSFIIKD